MTPVRGTVRKAGMVKSSLTPRNVSLPEAREADSLLEGRLEEIAGAVDALGHRVQVELRRIEAGLHLAPAQRRGDRRAGHAAQRVGRDGRLAVGVLHAVEVEAALPLGERSP